MVAWSKRINSLLNMPTFAEAGLRSANDPAWHGFVTLAGTLGEVIRRPNEASVEALREPGLVNRFRGTGAEPVGNTPQQYAAETRHEFEKMHTLVKQQNIKLEQ